MWAISSQDRLTEKALNKTRSEIPKNRNDEARNETETRYEARSSRLVLVEILFLIDYR